MTVYVMDDDYAMLKQFEYLVSKINPDIQVKCFTNSIFLFAAVGTDHPDLVFIKNEFSTTIRTINHIKECIPSQKIVLVTKPENYLPAFNSLGLFNVVRSPVDEESIIETIEKVHHPIIFKLKKLLKMSHSNTSLSVDYSKNN